MLRRMGIIERRVEMVEILTDDEKRGFKAFLERQRIQTPEQWRLAVRGVTGGSTLSEGLATLAQMLSEAEGVKAAEATDVELATADFDYKREIAVSVKTTLVPRPMLLATFIKMVVAFAEESKRAIEVAVAEKNEATTSLGNWTQFFADTLQMSIESHGCTDPVIVSKARLTSLESDAERYWEIVAKDEDEE